MEVMVRGYVKVRKAFDCEGRGYLVLPVGAGAGWGGYSEGRRSDVGTSTAVNTPQ